MEPDGRERQDQKRRMFITIPFDEGERWKFGQVSIDGNKVYPEQNLLRAFERPGRRLAALEGARRRRQGRSPTPTTTPATSSPRWSRSWSSAATGWPTSCSTSARGTSTRSGGSSSRATRARGQGAAPRAAGRRGRVVIVTAVRNSVTKVNQLGYFKLSEENPVKIDYDSENKKVDLIFKGEESERTQLEVGGGWSELDGFFGQFAISTKNFLGRGEQVGVSIQTGKLPRALRPLLLDPLVPRPAAEHRHPRLPPGARLQPVLDQGQLPAATARARCSPTGATRALPGGEHQLLALEVPGRDPDPGAGSAARREGAAPRAAEPGGRDHRQDDLHRQLVDPPGLRLRQPGQPLRDLAAARSSACRPSSPAASSAATPTFVRPEFGLQPVPAGEHPGHHQDGLRAQPSGRPDHPLRRPRRAALRAVLPRRREQPARLPLPLDLRHRPERPANR